jgi:hypothetical protein
MSILDNIREKKRKIILESNGGVDPDQPGTLPSMTAEKLKNLGLKAISGGTAEWVLYMQEFAKTPEELARLIPTDGSQDQPDMNDARAYLIANGPCGVDTVTRLDVNVTEILDQPLD